jgi:hypothetical protein
MAKLVKVMHFAPVCQVQTIIFATITDLEKMGLVLLGIFHLALVALNATEKLVLTANVCMETVRVAILVLIPIVLRISAHSMQAQSALWVSKPMVPAPRFLWEATVLQDFNVQLTFA